MGGVLQLVAAKTTTSRDGGERGASGGEQQREGHAGGSGAEETTEFRLGRRDQRQQLEAALGTRLDAGLTSAEVRERLARFGRNALTPPKRAPPWLRFAKHLFGGFSALLWAGSVLCFIVYGINGSGENLSLGIVLAAVVCLTATFSHFQESKSEKVIEGFARLTPADCDVKRNGEWTRCPADGLVVGDVVRLQNGEKVPADCVVVETSGALKVDNSSLTGEAEPLRRSDQPTSDSLWETKNVAFFGTAVVEGSGVGAVARTGDRTALGGIAAAATGEAKPETLMKAEIRHFIKIISGIAALIGVVFFVVALVSGYAVVDAVVFTIAIIVANVPEGLLATVTVALTITAKRMASKNVMVRNVETIETLGAVTVIASDKTGTLTQNRMTVRHAVYDKAAPGSAGGAGSGNARRNHRRESLPHRRSTSISSEGSQDSWRGSIHPVARRSLSRELSSSSLGSLGAGFGSPSSVIRVPSLELRSPLSPAAAPAARAGAAPGFGVNKASALGHRAAGGTDQAAGSGSGGDLADLVRCAVVCNHARLVPQSSSSSSDSNNAEQQQQQQPSALPSFAREAQTPASAAASGTTFVPLGNASEVALVRFAEDCRQGATTALRAAFPEVAAIPFNSSNKWMATVHRDLAGGPRRFLVCVKGAPERVLPRCAFAESASGESVPLDEETRASIEDANAELAANGERVLAFADATIEDADPGTVWETDDPETANFPLRDLRFLGLLSLEDPPREEVPAAIAACHEAGIRVVMVTGDQPLTARSIARQVGILPQPSSPDEDEDEGAGGAREGSEGPSWLFRAGSGAAATAAGQPSLGCRGGRTSAVVAGWDLGSLTDEDWACLMRTPALVFARTLPEQKQDIVRRFQEAGNVVAVTGDGVNDSPALKKADVGIAMGSGSDVAKDSADMVLADDNFASIVKGVEEGRLIFANLKKSIAYTLSSNIPEITPFLALIALRIPPALLTVQILAIDLGTDLLPAISLAYERAEHDIMRQPPRDRLRDKLVNAQLVSFSYLQIGVIQALAAFTAFFAALRRRGFSASEVLSARQGFDWTDESSAACVQDVDGACVGFDERSHALRVAQTAFLVSIVIVQWADVVICKSRLQSWRRQGMDNWVLNLGLLEETLLAIALVYVPFLNWVFGTEPLDFVDWLPALPFAAGIVLYDEGRKALVRRFKRLQRRLKPQPLPTLAAKFLAWFYY